MFLALAGLEAKANRDALHSLAHRLFWWLGQIVRLLHMSTEEVAPGRSSR